MAKARAKREDWNSWDILPEDDAEIVIYLNLRESVARYEAKTNTVYFGDGSMWPVEQGGNAKWKESEIVSNQTKPTETKPTPSKRFSLNISTDDLRRYIADGIKADTGATIADMWTNADDGFIVYGSGLGKVTK